MLLFVMLFVLVTDEVHGIHFFKHAPNQFRKRRSIEPSVVLAWCSTACEYEICRVVESTGKYDYTYNDCECGVDCYCLYSETRYSNYIYRCMPI